jgi:hypothetical protein
VTIEPPSFLQPLSSDEYAPLPLRASDRRAVARTQEALAPAVAGYGRALPSRLRTAAGLAALNAEAGERFYEVPPDALRNEETAAFLFAGRGPVIDVQTHFLAPHAAAAGASTILDTMYRALMPDWWGELDDIAARSLEDYVRNVFLECETSVAVLTSGPGLDDSRNLFNHEMAATRALIERLGGTGRLLSHCVVHADQPEELEAMAYWRDTFQPVGWKVYTPGRVFAEPDGSFRFAHGWMLDDEHFGLPFLERARELGVRLICAHKGISMAVDNGSPRDIGPSAKAFPELSFVVYHAGYELPFGTPPEGPFTEETRHLGVNRLIDTAREAGIGHGGNIFPELGTTWFSLIRRPEEAAHVIGKLIAHFGADNIIWGTDSAWYGSAQPLIDAFRVFQIPDWMCERYGYAPLNQEVKQKILAGNAARVYGIDLAAAERRAASDDLAWVRAVVADYREHGFPGLPGSLG